jgi:hypothetical protein
LEQSMSEINPSRGIALAAAVAALFSAACTGQEPQGQAEAQTAEDQPVEVLEWSIQPVDEAEKQPSSQAAPTVDQPTEAKVACFGINACKGQSDCATPKNACKGMNSCKGQGFKYVSLKECEAQGGKVGQPSM